MKVYLRWIGVSIALGSILAMFWGPENITEFFLNLPFAVGFWATMLLPALNAEE